MSAANRAATRRLLAAGDVDGLVRLHEPVAHGAVGGFYLNGGERDDLVQVARMAIAEAAGTFRGDPTHFNAFAERVATRRIMDAVTAANRLKHQPLSTSSRVHHGDGHDVPDAAKVEHLPAHPHSDPARAAMHRREILELIGALGHNLTDLERQTILASRLGGHSYQQIAEHLHISVKRVDNAIARAVKKLRAVRQQADAA